MSKMALFILFFFLSMICYGQAPQTSLDFSQVKIGEDKYENSHGYFKLDDLSTDQVALLEQKIQSFNAFGFKIRTDKITRNAIKFNVIVYECYGSDKIKLALRYLKGDIKEYTIDLLDPQFKLTDFLVDLVILNANTLPEIRITEFKKKVKNFNYRLLREHDTFKYLSHDVHQSPSCAYLKFLSSEAAYKKLIMYIARHEFIKKNSETVTVTLQTKNQTDNALKLMETDKAPCTIEEIAIKHKSGGHVIVSGNPLSIVETIKLIKNDGKFTESTIDSFTKVQAWKTDFLAQLAKDRHAMMSHDLAWPYYHYQCGEIYINFWRQKRTFVTD